MERMKISRSVALGGGLMMLAWAGPAKAELMAYEFAGVVDSFTDWGGVLDGSVQVGTEFSGWFTFDSEAEDSKPAPYSGVYTGPSFSMVVQAGSYSWDSGAGNGSISVQNDNFSEDSLSLGTAPFITDGIRIYMGGFLTDYVGSAFASDALPVLNLFPLSAFDYRSFLLDGVRLSDGATFKSEGTITGFTVVPEPCAIFLMALAFGVLQRRSVFRIA